MNVIAVSTQPRPVDRERVMWLTVILIAIEDFKFGKLRWNYFFTPDFEDLCFFARLRPKQVRQAARNHILPGEAKLHRTNSQERREAKRAEYLAELERTCSAGAA